MLEIQVTKTTLTYKVRVVLVTCIANIDYLLFLCQVSLTATVTCNQYYLLSCGADGAR